MYIFEHQNDDTRSQQQESEHLIQTKIDFKPLVDVRKKLMNALEQATHLEDYIYYAATKNLRHNHERYKAAREEFEEDEINSFLQLIKMGIPMTLYKTLMKTPNILNTSDSMGRTAVHWAVIRKQLECLRILL